jgi:arylsulfatase A-like enzyme
VTDARSTENQVRLAVARLEELPRQQRLFLFINVSALHQPNHHYLGGAERDTIESHAAALRYVDTQLAPLFLALERRGSFCMVMSDHGTAYGDDGYEGHRLAHPSVWNVPYGHFLVGAG